MMPRFARYTAGAAAVLVHRHEVHVNERRLARLGEFLPRDHRIVPVENLFTGRGVDRPGTQIATGGRNTRNRRTARHLHAVVDAGDVRAIRGRSDDGDRAERDGNLACFHFVLPACRSWAGNRKLSLAQWRAASVSSCTACICTSLSLRRAISKSLMVALPPW